MNLPTFFAYSSTAETKLLTAVVLSAADAVITGPNVPKQTLILDMIMITASSTLNAFLVVFMFFPPLEFFIAKRPQPFNFKFLRY